MVMKKFMDDNFMLNNETAAKLFNDYAKDMPIFDYHCHLSPQMMYEDKPFENITQIFLGGDHYKWRYMRSNGIDESYITGDKSDYDKFKAFCGCLQYAIGNPLYHWTHLELKRYFGIDEVLGSKTAEDIWERANKIIPSDSFTAKEIIKKSNVEIICTTDDPADDLKYHKAIKEDKDFPVKVFPAFRPDRAINIEKEDFVTWLGLLEKAVGKKINDINGLLSALVERIEYFHEAGCRLSDHALEPVMFRHGNISEMDAVFRKALLKESFSESDLTLYKGQLMLFLGKEYAKRGWTMQIHTGTMRNNNTKMFRQLGPDTGFDAVGDYSCAKALSDLLNNLDYNDKLPKTILYCLNPNDNFVLGTLLGCFQDGKTPGKIQFGSAWWFNDQKEGMITQMTDLANLGLLPRFVGMLTDSRSFLSYTRHEYFRRILCNLIGEWVTDGEFPYDTELLGNIVQNISYTNAKNYFGLI